MNIAVVHQRWSRRGGAEKYLEHLVKALIERGHTVELFVHFIDIPVPAGVMVHRVPLVRFPLWLRLLSFNLFSNYLLKRASFDISISLGKVWGPDVIRPAGGCHRAYEHRTMTALAETHPLSHPFRSIRSLVSPFQIVNRLIEDRLFAENNTIIAVSDLVKSDILHHYRRSEGSVRVIPNGRDPHMLDEQGKRAARARLVSQTGLPDQAFIMLMVATNPLLKGLEYLVRALSILPDSLLQKHDPQVIIIGSAPNRVIRKRVRRYQASERTHFIPFSDEISLYYQGADLLVHPSSYDAFANVCLEAMSWGLPVLTSAQNGGAEIYTQGRDGWVIERPWERELFAQILAEIMQHPDLSDIGRKGHDLLQTYSAQRNLDCVEQLLLELVSQKRNHVAQKDTSRSDRTRGARS
ncbi:glycosyltransferase family 4 protein [bacterium]|nr:glycosyltransferase family 4 protein [bacterium]